jgi:galactokinase
MPMAIPFATVASIQRSEDGRNHFASAMFSRPTSFPADDRAEARGDWTDYPVGVLRQLQQLGIELPAFRLSLRGDVPLGSGLSSSASVEVASALAMLSLAGQKLTVEELALLCQRAENQYVHSPCGIMDQFVIAAAKAGHALLLHTRTLAYEHLPMNQGELAGASVVVCNSMVKHSVAAGEYGNRRLEVEAGQAIARKMFPGVQDLGEATLAQLEQVKGGMSPESYLRCRHIVSENARVVAAKEAMFAGDPVRLGELMIAAHASERDDFACSCDEVDFLVKTAIGLRGCYGARLTGGGFGGCTVNLVKQEDAQTFAKDLAQAYERELGIKAETYLCNAVDGAVARLETAREAQA